MIIMGKAYHAGFSSREAPERDAHFFPKRNREYQSVASPIWNTVAIRSGIKLMLIKLVSLIKI